MAYELGVDPGPLRAIDTHVHIEVDDHGHHALPGDLVEAANRYFRSGTRPSLDEIADTYRGLGMAAVVFTVDARTNLGHEPVSSIEVARGAARNNDVLIPFGSVDPTRGEAAIDEARRLVAEEGVRGFKFHPTVQAFDPSDEAHWPLFAELERLGTPAVFHTGQTGIGAGMPGGRGLRLAYSNPMLLDAVAAAFPTWQIVMAHPSVPWQDEAISVATHKANTWIDLSGWSPKYFPEPLVRASRSFLQDRVLFGSDYPLIDPVRWLRDFDGLGFDEPVREKLLKTNAMRLLGLGEPS